MMFDLDFQTKGKRMKILKWIPIAVLILALLGCSFTVNVPEVKTGPIEIAKIQEAYPAGMTNPILHIDMGAGTLNLTGGSSNMVEGEIQYNIAEWVPGIKQTPDGLSLSQNETKNIGIPSGNIINDWNLKLGNQPMRLLIAAGAYSGIIDLSGVPLTSLEVSVAEANQASPLLPPIPQSWTTFPIKPEPRRWRSRVLATPMSAI